MKRHTDIIDSQNILMCGPIAPPVHGQSFSFTLITEYYLCKNKYVVNQNFNTRSLWEKLSVTISSVSRYLRFFISKDIDLVYCSGSRSVGGCIKDLFLINISSLLKKKIVSHIHGADFDSLLEESPGLLRFLIKYSYNKVNTVIVLVEGMKASFTQFKSMRIEVLPNFYDPVLDEYEKPGEKIDNDVIELVYFSNIMKTKGIIELIAAFDIVSTKITGIRLNIAGAFIDDGECSADQIKTLFFQKIEHKKNIVYYGAVSGERKSELLYRSDVFVLPSYYKSEAFPLSIIEAMRAGCAIITTDHHYLGEIVKAKNGMLVAIHDVPALAGAIEYLIQNKGLLNEIKENNINEAKNKYSLSASLRALNSIFNA